MSDDDITANYHGGNQESIEAHARTKHNKRRDCTNIIILLASYPHGLTCDEVEVLLGMRHQTCSARFTDLKRDGVLVPVDLRRRTRTGSWARVFTLARFERASA